MPPGLRAACTAAQTPPVVVCNVCPLAAVRLTHIKTTRGRSNYDMLQAQTAMMASRARVSGLGD